MWAQTPTPMSEEDREREIQRLERVRDMLLDEAPMHFYFKRLLLPLMLVPALIAFGDAIWAHPATLTFMHGLLFAVFLVMAGSSTWKAWKSTPVPGDKWGYSDGLGYEGDSPREIQKTIDQLRNTPRA